MINEMHDLSGAYALDALDADERDAYEAHLETCASCRAEVDSFRDVTAALASSVQAEPPASIFDAVMAEIATTEQLKPEQGAPPVVSIAPAASEAPPVGRFGNRNVFAAAAAVLLLVVGGIAITSRGSQPSVEELASVADAVPLELAATTADQIGQIEILWSPDRDQVAVIASDLADPGDGQVYALWFLVDDGVAPAALFQPSDGSVEQVLDVDDLTANGWGITIEPEGGSDQPTSPVIFAGDL